MTEVDKMRSIAREQMMLVKRPSAKDIRMEEQLETVYQQHVSVVMENCVKYRSSEKIEFNLYLIAAKQELMRHYMLTASNEPIFHITEW